jgi:AbrB family looped-hinge helix DNA binding protein
MELKKGRHFFGSVKIGEKGQLVIPKEAREIFAIRPGDTVLILGDVAKGLAIVKPNTVKGFALKLIEVFGGKAGRGGGEDEGE